MRILFIIFLLPSYVFADYYVCFNEDKTDSVLFSWNEEEIRVNRHNFLFEEGYIKLRDELLKYEPDLSKHSFVRVDKLEPHMKDSTYTTKNTENELTVRVILDLLQTKIERANGEIINHNSDIFWSEIQKNGYVMIFYAVMPVVEEHSFNKKTKTLKRSYETLFNTRTPTKSYHWIEKPYKEKNWLEPGDDRASIERIKYLTQEEIEKVFYIRDYTSSNFTKCKKKFSIVGKFLHFLQELSWVWSI